MKKFNDLLLALENLQSKTIGLFVNDHNLSSKPTAFELVVEEDSGMLRTVYIGNLGGLTEILIPRSRGVFKKFPDNQTLSDLKKNPYALNDFVKDFFKQ